jgi:hypothetical protein
MTIQIRDITGPKAWATITHARAYDFDEKRGVWLTKVVDVQEVHNIITDAGRRRIHTYLYGAGSQRSGLGGGLNYIALSNDATAPAASDTTLAGEITDGSAAGLGRALATVTLPTGSGTQTVLQKIFTYTGAPGPQGVQKTALFDDASTGTMAHEIQFAPRTLFTNDTLTCTFAISLS